TVCDRRDLELAVARSPASPLRTSEDIPSLSRRPRGGRELYLCWREHCFVSLLAGVPLLAGRDDPPPCDSLRRTLGLALRGKYNTPSRPGWVHFTLAGCPVSPML